MTFAEACELLGGPLEPTRDDLRNGWTAATLTVYHAERATAASDLILNRRPAKPTRTKNAMRWL